MESAVRPTDKPLAWVGPDRILLDDVTCHGLKRKVIARKDDWPDVMGFLAVAYKQAGDAPVSWWLVQKPDQYWYLWIVWKEG